MLRGSERERRRRNLINRVAVHFNSIRFDYYLIIRPAVTIVFRIPCLGIYIGGMSFAAATDTGQHDCRQLVIQVYYRRKDGLRALQDVWRRAPLVITIIHLPGSRSGPVVTCVILVCFRLFSGMAGAANYNGASIREVADDVMHHGEGPFWDSQNNVLYFVDISRHRVYRLRQNQLDYVQLGVCV